MISVYGSSGFIGSRFCEMYPKDVIRMPRDKRSPESDELLYFISTTHMLITGNGCIGAMLEVKI